MVQRAGGHGLAFLAEARPESMFPGNHGPKVAEYVQEKGAGVQVLVEQYMDFVVNRLFRESLLVHAERARDIRYQPDRSRYKRMHFAAWVPPVDGETRMDYSRQEYLESDGSTLFTNDPGIKAALDALSDRWPWTISRHELVDEVAARLDREGFSASADLPNIVDNLLEVLVLQGQVRFRVRPMLPESASAPLKLVEPIRRMSEITRDDSDASLFNLWHETLLPSPVDRHLLPLLDGSRGRDALLDALLAVDRRTPIPMERDGEPVSGEGERRAFLVQHIDELPHRLAEMKLARID
jgi:methyltransferase-like protein